MDSPSMYTIRVYYKCRLLLLSSDPDRIVFVNNPSHCWADGTPLSTEDMLGFLEYYGRDQRKPPDERVIRYSIGFVDGEGFDYGNGVWFDEEGRPLVEVVDGRIRAIVPASHLFLSGAGEGTPTIGDLYNELAKRYDVSWTDDARDSFFVHFHGAADKDYRLFVSCDYVDIAYRKHLFRWTWWESFSHQHHDADADGLPDVYATVRYYLGKYGM